MGFLGVVLTGDKKSIDIPPGFSLQLMMACLDLEKECPKSGHYSSVYVQPGGHDKFLLCHLGVSKDVNVAVQMEFGVEDSPVMLWCTAGQVHMTGRWALADDEEEEEEEEEEEFCQPAEPIKVAKAGGTKAATSAPQDNSKKRQREDKDITSAAPAPAPSSSSSNKTSSSSSSKPVPIPITAAAAAAAASAGQSRTAKKKAKAAENDELLALANMMAPQIIEAPTQVTQHHRKKWKVKPENEEGVQVPEPRQKTLPCGILYTDYVVGKGIEPKLGSKIKITYEGSFPDGTVFDTRAKRSKPFVFRKGAADVIRGLDLGVEGMRVGGSREIVLPPALG